MKKIVFPLFSLLFISTAYALECNQTPTDGCEVTQNTTFNPGTYSLPNGIIINADNIVLDCNNAVLNGLGSNTGIYLNNKNNNIVKNCTVSNYNYGIYLIGSKNNVFKGNNLTGNTEHNLVVFGEFYNDIDSSNVVDGKPVYYLVSEHDKIVPSDAGYIALVNCSNITVSNISLTKQYYGILLYKTVNSTIENVDVVTNEYGIYVYYSDFNNFVNNDAYLNDQWGVYLDTSDYNNLIDNKVYFNIGNYAIHVYSSDYNKLANNNIYSNDGYGLYSCYSFYNNLTGNIFESNERDLVVRYGHYNDIDSSNTVDGKPVYYWVSQHNKIVPSDAGYVALVNSSNITVSNISLSDEYYGILLYKTTNSLIENVELHDNNYGIYMDEENNGNTIKNCDINSNSISGIYFLGSKNNSVFNNNIKGNKNGIYITSSDFLNNSIAYNNLAYNNYNIYNYQNYQNISAENNWWGSPFYDYINSSIYNYHYGNIIIDFEPWLYRPYDELSFPMINSIECENGSDWVDCRTIKYGNQITKVRANCTDDGYVSKVNFTLRNESFEMLFEGDGIYESGYYVFDNGDLEAYHELLSLFVECRDNSSEKYKKVVTLTPKEGLPDSIIFYDGFEDLNSAMENNGTFDGFPEVTNAIIGNGFYFGSYSRVCYPIEGNFDNINGTIEFWVKVPEGDAYGFFDIDGLGSANSWGIFKNSNRLIMEVKNENNALDQAWSSNSWSYDGQWHFVSAVWTTDEDNCTWFKVFLDGTGKTEYDGHQCNSYPNMEEDFCLGWCGWYGHSESVMDEVKIYNYVKSDEEIMEDYLSINNTQEEGNKTIKECIMYKPQSTGNVQINCSGLYVNNEKFTVKGVGYQPIPIGMTAESIADKQKMYNDIRIRQRDFPLLREMGANTIRTWSEVLNKTFMDDLYNEVVNPIYVLMGFWIQCGEDYGSPTVMQGYIDDFTAYVNEYKDHPSVLAWMIGNENNLEYCSTDLADFYSLANELGRIAYEIEGENHHPIAIVNGDLGGIGNSYYGGDDESLDYIDFWGLNSYRGNSFGSLFEEYSYLSGKPMVITEYGTDALNNFDYQEIEEVQQDWNIALWKEIENNTLGGTIMAYSDEWWKGSVFGNCGSKWTHDYECGHGDFPTPDGWSNEEWYGVMRTIETPTGEVDGMEPRLLYYALQQEFKEKTNITIDLIGGWNLISIPLILENNSIDYIFNNIDYSKIFAYINNEWIGLNNDDKINNSIGLWIKMNADDTLIVEGLEPSNTLINLNEGNNLIGYPSLEEKNVGLVFNDINDSLNNVYNYENNTWFSYNPLKQNNKLNIIKPGLGYWVNANKNTDLVIP